MKGELVSIHVCESAGKEMTEIQEAELVAGRGIVGDRYSSATGTFSEQLPGPDHELTLVAAEEVARFSESLGRDLGPGELRRNLVTRGIELNELVDREFTIGKARARGIRLCEPCAYLARLVGPEVLPALLHRAGLRATIVESGTIRPGDCIETL